MRVVPHASAPFLVFALAALVSAPTAAAQPPDRAQELAGHRGRVRRAPDSARVVELGGLTLAAPPAATDAEAAARWFADDNGGVFGLDPSRIALGVATVHQHLDQRIVAFPLLLEGLPVFHGRLTVQVGPGGVIRRAALSIPPPSGASGRADETARARALAWAAERGLEPTGSALGWLVAFDETRPVVRLTTRERDDLEPLAWYLDAASLAVLHSEPLRDLATRDGLVLAENPISTPTLVRVELRDLDEDSPHLHGKYARVESCVDHDACAETIPLAYPDLRGSYDYAPHLDPFSFDDPFAEVNLYHHVSKIARWVRQTFKWKGLIGTETWIAVKAGREWYNAAYYHGTDEHLPFLVFGQDEVDFAYDADVATHEYGHAINREIWSHFWAIGDGYGLNLSPYGLEETLADVWAETLAGDPVMNSYIKGSRTADNALTCPEAVHSEGHKEAEIVSAFAWDARERIGATAWDQVVFRSLAFLSAGAAFDEFAEVLAGSATDLAAEGAPGAAADHAALILDAAAARGLFDEDCLRRLVPLPEGEWRRVYGYGRDRTAGYSYPLGLQWKIETPADAAAFRLALEWAYPDGATPGYRVHVSRGAPARVSWLSRDEVAEGDPVFEVTADHTFEGAPTAVDFPFVGLDPLAPGEVVYVLLSADADPAVFVVEGRVRFLGSLPPPPPAETTAAPPAGVTGGRSFAPACAVRAPGARTGLLALLLALAG